MNNKPKDFTISPGAAIVACQKIMEIKQQDPGMAITFGEQFHREGRKKLLKEIKSIITKAHAPNWNI